ncbi:MAG: ribonuclease HI [Synergistaceae bacterium]|nr:ribonuclease HI [Synergistaceae bacterium]
MHSPMPDTKVIIYTDGGTSPNPGLGGWAAILQSPVHGAERELFGAEADTTNNRMELTAAIQALRALKRPCQVDLHTDSTYLRNAFELGWLVKWRKNGWRNSQKEPVLNRDLWEELWALTQTHRVRWHWVKGHADDELNNRCDALVRRAREEFGA